MNTISGLSEIESKQLTEDFNEAFGGNYTIGDINFDLYTEYKTVTAFVRGWKAASERKKNE